MRISVVQWSSDPSTTLVRKGRAQHGSISIATNLACCGPFAAMTIVGSVLPGIALPHATAEPVDQHE
jgi:hypothetical protein